MSRGQPAYISRLVRFAEIPAYLLNASKNDNWASLGPTHCETHSSQPGQPGQPGSRNQSKTSSEKNPVFLRERVR